MIKEILFFQSISEESIRWLIQQIGDEKEVKILMHCGGGESGCANAFYEYVQLKKIKLHVHVLNACMSAAVTILCAAQTRTACPNARFVLHPVRKYLKDESFGQNVMENILVDFQHINACYIKLIKATINNPKANINKLCSQETFLTAKEAWKLGFGERCALELNAQLSEER